MPAPSPRSPSTSGIRRPRSRRSVPAWRGWGRRGARQLCRHERGPHARAALRCGLAGTVGAARDGADAADAAGGPAHGERWVGEDRQRLLVLGEAPVLARTWPIRRPRRRELSLSRAFAELYARDGVLVNAVAPGPVAGELWLAPGGLADQAPRRARPRVTDVLAGVAARTRWVASGPIRRSPT